MPTKIIDNFSGRMTRINYGDLNSGLTKYSVSTGYLPFQYPEQLYWAEQPTQIDPNGAVITDLIMDGQERVESGTSYLYAIGHTGRLYKIQVNDPASFNPNYDNPVLLATLTINSPTFTRGASMDFFGATEKIYIGHDVGVTSINFDGTGEAFVGILGSWVQNVPRILREFVGKLYIGNGNNLAEIDSTATVTTYTKLTPSFPVGTQVRDLDQSSDGNYLFSVVTRLALPDLTSTVQDTTLITNAESYVFKWNGTDQGYTAFDSYPSFSLNGNIMFGDSEYVFGYDVAGACVFNPTRKILSNILAQAPLPNAIGSNGGFVAWAVPEFYQGFLRVSHFLYGFLDDEVPNGWYRQISMSAQGGETDILKVPFSKLVSNFLLSTVTSGYANGLVSSGKLYFSTLETSPAPTTKYKLYKWSPVPIGLGTAAQGVYETQSVDSFKLFRSNVNKKFKVTNVRMYTAPLVAGNSFKIDLIGSDGNPMSGGTQTFTVGTNVTAGQDYVWYTPQTAPTHSLALRISNLGAVNWIGVKCELDYEEAGQ